MVQDKLNEDGLNDDGLGLVVDGRVGFLHRSRGRFQKSIKAFLDDGVALA